MIIERLGVSNSKWDWLGKHYLDALELVPLQYLKETRRKLEKHIPLMQPRDVGALRGFDLEDPRWNRTEPLTELRELLGS